MLVLSCLSLVKLLYNVGVAKPTCRKFVLLKSWQLSVKTVNAAINIKNAGWALNSLVDALSREFTRKLKKVASTKDSSVETQSIFLKSRTSLKPPSLHVFDIFCARKADWSSGDKSSSACWMSAAPEETNTPQNDIKCL